MAIVNATIAAGVEMRKLILCYDLLIVRPLVLYLSVYACRIFIVYLFNNDDVTIVISGDGRLPPLAGGSRRWVPPEYGEHGDVTDGLDGEDIIG